MQVWERGQVSWVFVVIVVVGIVMVALVDRIPLRLSYEELNTRERNHARSLPFCRAANRKVVVI